MANSKQVTQCIVILLAITATAAFEMNNTAFGKVGTHKATMYIAIAIFVWKTAFNCYLWKGYIATKDDYSDLYEKEMLNNMWMTYTLLNPVFLGMLAFVLTTTVDRGTATVVMLELVAVGGSNGVLWGTVISRTTIFGQLAKTGGVVAAGLAAIGKEHAAPPQNLLINCSSLLLMYLLVEGIVLIQIVLVFNHRIKYYNKANREIVFRTFRKVHEDDVNLQNTIKTIDSIIKTIRPMNNIDWEKECGSTLRAIQCHTDTSFKFLQIPLAQGCVFINELYAIMVFINGILCVCISSMLSGELLVATIMTCLSSIFIMIMQYYSGPNIVVNMHPPTLPTNYKMQRIVRKVSELTPREVRGHGTCNIVLKKCLEKMLSVALGCKKRDNTWHISGSFVLKDSLHCIRLFMPILDDRSSRANADRAEQLTAWTLLFIGISAVTGTKGVDIMEQIQYTIVDDDGLLPERSTYGYLHPDESSAYMVND